MSKKTFVVIVARSIHDPAFALTYPHKEEKSSRLLRSSTRSSYVTYKEYKPLVSFKGDVSSCYVLGLVRA
jgi:hypothetical protein